MDANEEFLKALTMIETIDQPEHEYRVYYDDLGNITKCSMINHSTVGEYIIVSEQEYLNYFHYRVVNNALKKIDINLNYSVQLTKANSGFSTVKNHAGLIIETDEAYDDRDHYDQRNN